MKRYITYKTSKLPRKVKPIEKSYWKDDNTIEIPVSKNTIAHPFITIDLIYYKVNQPRAKYKVNHIIISTAVNNFSRKIKCNVKIVSFVSPSEVLIAAYDRNKNPRIVLTVPKNAKCLKLERIKDGHIGRIRWLYKK